MFNLQPTLFFALLGVVLYIVGAFENSLVLTLFYVAIIVSIVYAVCATILKLLGLDKKIFKSKGVQIMGEETAPKTEEVPDDVEKTSIEEYPKYFRVKQNPNYVMAEFEDRYELYMKTADGLKKIRTDYK